MDGADHAITVTLAQVNPLVGDIAGNTQLILDATRRAVAEHGAKVVLFPELALTGYPPEDLLLRPAMCHRVERALETLCRCVDGDVHVVLGYPKRAPEGLLNMAGVVHRGQIVAEGAKCLLPNYQVFDERRYFVPGQGPVIFPMHGFKTALSICEDLWQPEPARHARAAGAELLINLNASPFHIGKPAARERLVCRQAADNALPILYVNAVGGQDELVFDGGSMAADGRGELMARAPHCVDGLYPVRLGRDRCGQVSMARAELAAPGDEATSVYQVLLLGLRDYVEKNGFQSVILGLSGGIDSALTLALAADALGAARVTALMMPSRYTSAMSLQDAEAEANALGVRYRTLSIEPLFEALLGALSEDLRSARDDSTEQNLQARCRGLLLMALSNRYGSLVLTTSNKSELAVGYATLYGDMAGGFNALKDVSKTRVYELARYRNQLSSVIPERVISRTPSAELAPDQKDSDSLPPYDVLDPVLQHYVENDLERDGIVQAGFAPEHVDCALLGVNRSEYKRRQAALGPRITERGFGRDRRHPVTSGWTLEEPDWAAFH